MSLHFSSLSAILVNRLVLKIRLVNKNDTQIHTISTVVESQIRQCLPLVAGVPMPRQDEQPSDRISRKRISNYTLILDVDPGVSRLGENMQGTAHGIEMAEMT